MEHDYERYALILDTESGPLGRAAMELVEMGVDVLYANDVDEAELLARQESTRVGALLIPAATPPERVEAAIKRICPRIAAGGQSLVMAGLEPEETICNELREAGARWCLWEPYSKRDLRFVMTAAMSIGDSTDARSGLRIPTDLTATACMGRHRKDVLVDNLSESGAYLDTEHPFLEGSELCLDITLPEGSFIAKATVVNARTDGTDRADVPPGMGVRFVAMNDESDDRLRAFIADWVTRFWV